MKIQYPTPQRCDCVEDLHGDQVDDPYRWMEDPDAEETKEYVDLQNKITMPYLENCCVKKKFHEKLVDLFDFPKQGCPFKRGDKFYYNYNSGLQNQYVLYQQDSPESPGEVFLDPNTLSEDGTVSVGCKSFSEDGKILAYTISVSGSDWKTVKFMRTDTKEQLEDVLENVKFSCLSWTHDNKGLFYNKYPKAATSDLGTETNSNIHQKLYYHRLGTSQSDDVLVLELPDEPHWMPGCEVSDCGKVLLLSISKGCEPVNKYWVHDLPDQGLPDQFNFTKIVDNFDAEYDYIANNGRVFYLKTNLKADRYKLISIDLDNPSQDNWKEIIPEKESVLDWIACVRGDLLVTCYTEDCVNKLYIHQLESGALVQAVEIPPGSIVGYSGRIQDSFIYFKFTSFINPGVIYSMDLSKGDDNLTAQVFKETPIKGLVSSDYVTKQIFFNSKDGTKVPMFVTHHKDLVLDGNNPTLMYGYGGFNISLSPSYSSSRMIFIKFLGGVFCEVNMRGGGEYGNDWHHAGSLANKQNVFDDFISAGEELVKQKYTSPSKLAIEGGSNGGLLVAACANQRPDLFGAVICHVGVLDMYRFQKFTIGHAWMTEFGNPEKKDEWKWVKEYSPLHNIPDKGTYPATLLLTGDHDDRVVPLHSLKFIATLQHKLGASNPNPLLIRVDTKSGHGAGKPTAKRLIETADCYAFIAAQLGAEWHQ